MLLILLFKAKYFPNCDFLESRCGHSPSHAWRSIWGVKGVVKDGYKWSIGLGEAILFWDQNWLVYGNAIDKNVDLPEKLNSLIVADLWNHHLRIWNVGALQQLVTNSDIQRILHTPVLNLFKLI